MLLSKDINKADLQICSRCIYDERVPGIEFNSEGICNYCQQVDDLIEQYGYAQKKGIDELNRIISKIKKSGKKRKYDCVVGVSGGTDSSYMLYLTKEWGLRPLAVHYDNTWNTAIATQNIRKMLSKLGIDLYTKVVNNKEADDIFRSFFEASVAELDASTDLAYAETMYRAAAKYRIKYVFCRENFQDTWF
mgnify:FL=1